MSSNSLSQEAYDEFKKKLDYLKGKKRREISKAIGEAREHGDLKENSSYIEAKRDQSLNESVIADLEEKLRDVVIVKHTKPSDNSAGLGSKVKVKNIAEKDELEFTLVSELEADIFQNKISVESPLGSALLNSKVNETVEFNAPKGIVRFKVLEIS